MIPATVTCKVQRFDPSTYEVTLTVIVNHVYTERTVLLSDMFKKGQFEIMYKIIMEKLYKEIMEALPERKELS